MAPRARRSSPTYLPPFALFYGVTLLDEQLTANALLGLVLILGGVALGAGLSLTRRSRDTLAAPQRP